MKTLEAFHNKKWAFSFFLTFFLTPVLPYKFPKAEVLSSKLSAASTMSSHEQVLSQRSQNKHMN